MSETTVYINDPIYIDVFVDTFMEHGKVSVISDPLESTGEPYGITVDLKNASVVPTREQLIETAEQVRNKIINDIEMMPQLLEAQKALDASPGHPKCIVNVDYEHCIELCVGSLLVHGEVEVFGSKADGTVLKKIGRLDLKRTRSSKLAHDAVYIAKHLQSSVLSAIKS